MTPAELIRRRQLNQQLASARSIAAAELLGWMGALQAQDYLGALWAIGLRIPGLSSRNVEQALADGSMVRTWLMRGTLHLVAASDLPWMLGLLSGRIIAGNARRYLELGLDEQTMAQSNALLKKALQGRQNRSRTDLLGVLRGHGISTDGQRAAYLLQRAALEGLIAQGISQRNVPLYFALDFLPKAKPIPPEEALAELTRRYFQSRGPATLQDFMWWSGLSKAEVGLGLEANQSKLNYHATSGKTYWFMEDAGVKPPSATHLLPAFDEYLVAYKDRSAMLDPAHTQQINAGGGMLSPVVISNGRVIATWKRTLKKDTVTVELHRLAPFSKSQDRAISVAVERYSSFIGASTVAVI